MKIGLALLLLVAVLTSIVSSARDHDGKRCAHYAHGTTYTYQHVDGTTVPVRKRTTWCDDWRDQ